MRVNVKIKYILLIIFHFPALQIISRFTGIQGGQEKNFVFPRKTFHFRLRTIIVFLRKSVDCSVDFAYRFFEENVSCHR